MSFRTHVRERLTDAEAASIIACLKFAVPNERAQTSNSDNSTSDNSTSVSSDETTSSVSSVSSDESTSSDDDVVVYEGHEYAYRPPSVGDEIKVLCPPDWYAGKIKSIKKSRVHPYRVVFYRTSVSERETYHMSLDIKDYPSKWHFIDD